MKFIIDFYSMGKKKRSIDEAIKKDLQKVKKGELARILGGKVNKRRSSRWNNNNRGMSEITPQ